MFIITRSAFKSLPINIGVNCIGLLAKQLMNQKTHFNKTLRKSHLQLIGVKPIQDNYH